MRNGWLLLGVLVVGVFLFGGYFYQQHSGQLKVEKVSQPGVLQNEAGSSVATKFYYPISNYQKRLTFRNFGKWVDQSEEKNIACGANFVGFHDGNDLETTSPEQNTDVPVYAVTFGTVVSTRNVSGYGGLLIVSSDLPRGPATFYYGHVSLDSLTVETGTKVTPGEKLGNLGKGCSAETDGERKHLHFAIHLGMDTDVRGYVQTKTELEKWIDPLPTLTSLEAKEP